MAETESPGSNSNLGEVHPTPGSFSIQQIYTKDLSFESPNSPAIFHEERRPQVEMQLDSKATKLEEGLYEIVLTVTVTAKVEDSTAFLIETQQAGVFLIGEFSEAERAWLLGSNCPGILYPYAREAISSMSIRGGFPPVFLAAVNFDTLYQMQAQQSVKPN